MMKYLWLIFILCVVGLAFQIKLSRPEEGQFTDGRLACLPLPPALARAEPPLLPPPVLQQIPPVSQPARVVATSIEIFDYSTNPGLLETQLADKLDWGLPRLMPSDSPTELTYAVEPRLIQPVPVNVPPPAPSRIALEDLITTNSYPWSPALSRLSPDHTLVALIKQNPPSVTPSSRAAVASASDSPSESMTFYLPQENIQTASLAPAQLIERARSSPNLYLPEGALDEEGAMLTLIKPELRVYDLPDESSSSSAETLKDGDQVRPLTRLRNSEGFDWIKFERDGKSYWAQAEYFIRVDPRNRRQFPKGNLPVGQEAVDKDSALPVDYQPDDLRKLDQKHVFGPREVLMREEAAEAFEKMAEAARAKGLTILAFSGFRDFDYQKRLYLEAVERHGPKQNGTAAPGYSEHQLGTTADICSDNRRTILSGTFGETPEGRWLHENSEKFGFRKSYTQENTEEVGYKPEPWHFRYVGNAQKTGNRAVANQ